MSDEQENILAMYADESEFLESDEKSSSKRKIPSAYAHLTWEKYQTALLTERCASMLRCAPWQWIPWVRENKDRLARELNHEAKESFRRMAQSSMEGCRGWSEGKAHMTPDDINLINEVFGPYKEPYPPASMMSGYGYGSYTGHDDPFYGQCPTKDPHGVLEYMSDTTYGWFWKWMHDEPMISNFIGKLSDGDVQYLTDHVIERVIRQNVNLSPNARYYMEGDREEYYRIIEKARSSEEA